VIGNPITTVGTALAALDADDTAPVPLNTPPAVSTLTSNIGSSGTSLAHVPACGNQPTITFTAGPATATPVTWTLAAGTAQGATGSALARSANPRLATVAPGAAQSGGTLSVTAETTGGGQVLTYPLASHPTGITSIRTVSAPTSSTDYGGVFDHVFTSND